MSCAWIEENMWLVKRIAGKHNYVLPRSIDHDDLVQIGTIGLLKAASKVNPNKHFFQAFATKVIRDEIRMELRKYRTEKRGKFRSVSLDQSPAGEDGRTLHEIISNRQDILEKVFLSEFEEHKFCEADAVIVPLFLTDHRSGEIQKKLGESKKDFSNRMKGLKNILQK